MSTDQARDELIRVVGQIRWDDGTHTEIIDAVTAHLSAAGWKSPAEVQAREAKAYSLGWVQRAERDRPRRVDGGITGAPEPPPRLNPYADALAPTAEPEATSSVFGPAYQVPLPPLRIDVRPDANVEPKNWHVFRSAAAEAVAGLMEDYCLSATVKSAPTAEPDQFLVEAAERRREIHPAPTAEPFDNGPQWEGDEGTSFDIPAPTAEEAKPEPPMHWNPRAFGGQGAWETGR